VLGVSFVLLMLAALLRVVPRGRGRWASTLALRASGLVLASSFVVGSLVAPLGLGYHPPVVLSAPGTMAAVLVDRPGFVPVAGAVAECTSVGDGTDVAGVLSLDLGELEGATLRGLVRPPHGGAPGALELWIDAGDLSAGRPMPLWSGPVREQDLAGDASVGRVVFAGLAPGPAGSPEAQEWGNLTGELSWTCAAWP